ncbi:MAG: YeeE/YedE family protein, partial [Rhodocyclaceae bacterium]|nr:YeeE/YedE family protein [Rhodocyclaceae bacterium]
MNSATSAVTNLATTVAWLSFVVAFVLGAISARTQFCTLGAVSDIVNMNDWSRMRMWVLAMAVAIIGAQTLYALDIIDLSKAFYVRPNVTWLSYIVGGLLFGIGMTLASGCGSRTLVRIGGGNVKSIVV